MWPWGHAAVGYATYAVLSLSIRRRPPTTAQALVVVAGTQLPDVVDKPLSWTFGLLPAGRSLGHSLLAWVVVVALAVGLARRLDRPRLAPALSVGYLVGILTDVPASALSGDLSRATFLVWPLLPSPAYETEPTFSAHLGELTGADVAHLVFTTAAVVVIHVLVSLPVWWDTDHAEDTN